MPRQAGPRKRPALLSVAELEAQGYAEELPQQAQPEQQPAQQQTGPAALAWEAEEEDDLAGGDAAPDVPSDTAVALQLLRTQMEVCRARSGLPARTVQLGDPAPSQGVPTPIILRSQLYALVADRTEVDRALHGLRCARTCTLAAWPPHARVADSRGCSQTGHVRTFKLPSTIDDYAYMLAQDYAGIIDRAREAQVGDTGLT